MYQLHGICPEDCNRRHGGMMRMTASPLVILILDNQKNDSLGILGRKISKGLEGGKGDTTQ